MVKLVFDELSVDQAFALLSAYQSTKPAASNVIPFSAQSQAPAAPVSQPAHELPVTPPAAVVPTASTPTYTYEDLARAAAPLMDAGKTPELQALLHSFNVQALTLLPKNSTARSQPRCGAWVLVYERPRRTRSALG